MVDSIEEDSEELIDGDQIHEYDPDGDELNLAKASVLPRKLPDEVYIMNYSELWAWITEEILK